MSDIVTLILVWHYRSARFETLNTFFLKNIEKFSFSNSIFIYSMSLAILCYLIHKEIHRQYKHFIYTIINSLIIILYHGLWISSHSCCSLTWQRETMKLSFFLLSLSMTIFVICLHIHHTLQFIFCRGRFKFLAFVDNLTTWLRLIETIMGIIGNIALNSMLVKAKLDQYWF